ncbi:MAG: CocE/NonD family hydrolase [Lentisphaerota bacterium]
MTMGIRRLSLWKQGLLSAAFWVCACAGWADLLYQEMAIPVRDTNVLAADLWYEPPTPMSKPVILIQTPYDRTKYRSNDVPGQAGPSFPVSSNYNYVIVDWRGFYGSTNAGKLFYNRGLDGYDCCEWIATQAWCNGVIGTWGSSALGYIQYQTAEQHPPHLYCCAIQVKDFQNTYSQFYYGGDYRKEHVESVDRLGLSDTNLVLNHPLHDAYWSMVERSTDIAATMAVPVLVVSGWFDHFPDEVLRSYDDLRRESEPSVRDRHRLIFGPWLHSGTGEAEQGAFTYANATHLAAQTIQFWDYYLRSQTNNEWATQPDVSYYQMGDDVWYEVASWTGMVRTARTLYLRTDGVLSGEAPPAGESPSTYVYDPTDPTPAFGGSRFNPFNPFLLLGPQNETWLELLRTDRVVYSTAVLTNDLRINGSVAVRLFISSSAPDTDFCVRLTDVDELDRSYIMTQGIRRGRFRESYTNESFWTPGEMVPVVVELQHIALTFKAGHRLRIMVCSADYPHFDLNRNDGGILYKTNSPLIVATNTIWQDAGHPSRIEFSVLVDDQDADGLPDAWEMNTLGSIRFTGAADVDGDGMANGDEYIAGTDPSNAASFFQCLENSGGDFPMIGKILSWPSATGRTYAVEYSTNVLQGFDAVLAPHLVATPPLNVYTAAAGSAGVSAFRIQVSR